MRPSGKKQAEEWGKRSADVQREGRLDAALNFKPIRSVTSTLIFEVRTLNPITGLRHVLELKHEARNGNDRYNLYIDGKCQRNQWSRWGFVVLMFNKIEKVRNDFAYEMNVQRELGKGAQNDTEHARK